MRELLLVKQNQYVSFDVASKTEQVAFILLRGFNASLRGVPPPLFRIFSSDSGNLAALVKLRRYADRKTTMYRYLTNAASKTEQVAFILLRGFNASLRGVPPPLFRIFSSDSGNLAALVKLRPLRRP